MLKYILLGLLSYRPMAGYDLKVIMEQSTMNFWHAHHSQIYMTLRKMEEDGLLISEVTDGDEKLARRVYTVTDSGMAHLNAWLAVPLTDVVQVKEELLVRIFFSGNRPTGDVLAELEVQRRLHQQKLATYQALSNAHISMAMPGFEDRASTHQVFWQSSLRFGMGYEKLYLQWLDETIRLIQEQL